MTRRALVSLIAFGVVAAAARPALAAPGDLDPSFGTAGLVRTNVTAAADAAYGVAIQPDGRIVAVGTASSTRRSGPAGSCRPTSARGRSTGRRAGSSCSRTATSWGGYTVSASSRGDPKFALARYLPDGTLDPAFGSGGKVVTNFTTGFDYVSGLALDAQGDIVAVGEAGARTAHDVAALARYTPDGVLDPTFGAAGKVTTDYGTHGDTAIAVAIDPATQDVVTAGAVGLGGSNPRFAVVRYTPAGVLDPAFGSGGKVFTDFSSSRNHANALAFQANGIVAAGVAAQGSGNSSFALARYLDS